ncbi:Golgi reassembly-stacking protein 1 [Mortierella alpina]|nr:Golgi reassembly-stacking protein 1 [Mortierella alpina]
MANTESTLLRDQMEASVDRPMVLDVYSTREQALRRIELVPRRNWSGADEDGLLGCSIRFTLFDTIIDVVWHVLDITPGSPAEQAGLCAHADYVIGTPLGIMRGEGDLYDLIEDYIGDPLPLHVYNVNRNEVREVVIVPSEEWGGEGLLGCDVGYGLPRQPSSPLKEQNESSKEDTPRIAGQPVSSQEFISPGLQEKHDINASGTAVGESKDEPMLETLSKMGQHSDSTSSSNVSEKEHIQHSDKQPSGSLEPATRPNDTQENPQQLGDEPSLSNGNPIAPMPIQETDLTLAAATQPTLYPQVSSPPLYPKVAAHDPPLSGSTLANGDADSNDHDAATTTPEANDTLSNAPLATDEKLTLETGETLSEESEQQQQHRQPPPALAARMMPGIHGRGGRRGHDGYAVRDRISLQVAQAQAEEQSAEYRGQMERDLKEERDQTNEREKVMQDTPGMGKDKGGEDKAVGDNTNSMMEQQEADLAVHEFVVEGMIRNMALGSTVFPL